ncbi:MAG: MraY family glycosyltransferase [Alistipes sp.]
MQNYLLIILPLFAAIIAVFLLHPQMVNIAKLKGIVDNPDARKLQKEPVPILGGVVVFFGIFFSVACTHGLQDCSSLYLIFSTMLIMLYAGTMDDILNLSPYVRFGVQIVAICMLIFMGGYKLNDFHGLWGIYYIPDVISIPLTIFAAVGVINAINLIDGVDGLSTGFCIQACIIFGTVFYISKVNPALIILAIATIGALIPVLLHNVFGIKSKMFIGDGGSLTLGLIMAVFLIQIIHSPHVKDVLTDEGYSPIAFTLAVLSIPVFDTLRVMVTRMLKHQSPFHPDKTHFHHLFIELGCSHIITTLCVLWLNMMVLLIWVITCYCGASADVQVYVVLLTSILFTTGIYLSFKTLQRRSPARFEKIIDFNRKARPRREGVFLTLQKLMDRM